ncbi:hypothetical protein CANARDRAFT_4981 [[Candida] arabinofermentans NRRL YB-2248]|uniref:3beta-hydroxysteroid 3-dehydrogenase n=1 Tax=[Candida] arabinofermentans NRRL YB-2248 TaxID=983967 RepID=A0A1E4T7M6_9ASCO|nr:hypothetical protein CANARDRAFT_4981 [[Candida] arabinofermentans NRRL YB-2248]
MTAEDNHRIAIITGTSSNLGINIAYRLLREVPSDYRLTIIVTSRTLPKAIESIESIKKYDETTTKRKGILEFDYLLIEFTNMVSIRAAVYELEKNYTKIDYLFINAAQGVYAGIDWIQATKENLTNPVKACTYPTYKIQKIGVKSKDGMGLVFQANVFGPYYLIESICQSLMSNSPDARIIWISSIMSKPSYLSFNDLQLLESDVSYEGSKRLVDLLHLSTFETLKTKYGIKQYVTQPGIFTSFSFFKFLNPFTFYGMLLLFYISRFLGSPWHNISGWNAANAPVFVCTKTDDDSRQDIKYGSATSHKGVEYLKNMEIDGTGKDDVLNYFQLLKKEWDDKLRDQIVDTRRAY